MTQGLKGLRALVVEDDRLVALSIEDMLEELGCIVSASAGTLREAVRIATDGGFDFALLDMNLAGEPALPVAEILSARRIPFAFATGYGASALPEGFRDRPVVAKPFQIDGLAAVIDATLSRKLSDV